MNCYHPILLPNPQYLILNSQILRSQTKYLQGTYEDAKIEVEYTPPYIYAPCRKCPACLKRRSLEWRGRLIREFEYHNALGKRTALVTLTYDNISVKNARERYRKDVGEFFDRMRSKFRRSIRHYVVAELGETRGRLHLHCLLFDCPDALSPDSHFRRSKNGALHGSNKILRERWRHGIVDIGFVKSVSGCAYVAKYVSKVQPTRQGEIYVSNIIASNGIGTKDVSHIEVDRIRTAIKNKLIPYYTVGGRDYYYPDSILRKYLDHFDRMELSRLCGLKSCRLGGSFVFGLFRCDSYHDYMEVVSSHLKGVTTYDLCMPKQPEIKPDYNVFLKQSPDYEIMQFLFPDGLPF